MPSDEFNPISDDELDEVRRFVDAGNGDVLPPDTLSRLLQRIDSDRWHLENTGFDRVKMLRTALGEIRHQADWAMTQLNEMAGDDGAIVKCAHCLKPLGECLKTKDCWLVGG